MQLNVISADTGSNEENIQVSDAIFGQPFNETLVHQVVTAYLAGARQGTHAQKNRSAVRGGGKKPWKQKGTGRARAGTIRSPIWRKGGVTFAAQPQDYSQKVNKKMYRRAMCGILSELVRQERLLLVGDFQLPDPKSKKLVTKLQKLGLEEVLIVADPLDVNLYLASRNIPRIEVCDVAELDPVSLIKFPKVLMTKLSLKKFEEKLA